MHTQLAQVLADLTHMTSAQFLERHTDPWLLCEIHRALPSTPAADILVPSTARSVPVDVAPVDRRLNPNSLLALGDRWMLHPVQKSDRNPWAERILVGRARNNDIVLSIQSVSRLQCYFVRKGAGFQLFACKTTSRTLLDGRPLLPGEGVDVQDGHQLVLGTVTAYFLEGSSLLSLLGRRKT